MYQSVCLCQLCFMLDEWTFLFTLIQFVDSRLCLVSDSLLDCNVVWSMINAMKPKIARKLFYHNSYRFLFCVPFSCDTKGLSDEFNVEVSAFVMIWTQLEQCNVSSTLTGFTKPMTSFLISTLVELCTIQKTIKKFKRISSCELLSFIRTHYRYTLCILDWTSV